MSRRCAPISTRPPASTRPFPSFTLDELLAMTDEDLEQADAMCPTREELDRGDLLAVEGYEMWWNLWRKERREREEEAHGK